MKALTVAHKACGTCRRAKVMQIELAKSIDVESTVNISIDDVTGMLHERMQHLEERFKEKDAWKRRTGI